MENLPVLFVRVGGDFCRRSESSDKQLVMDTEVLPTDLYSFLRCIPMKTTVTIDDRLILKSAVETRARFLSPSKGRTGIGEMNFCHHKHLLPLLDLLCLGNTQAKNNTRTRCNDSASPYPSPGGRGDFRRQFRIFCDGVNMLTMELVDINNPV